MEVLTYLTPYFNKHTFLQFLLCLSDHFYTANAFHPSNKFCFLYTDFCSRILVGFLSVIKGLLSMLRISWKHLEGVRNSLIRFIRFPQGKDSGNIHLRKGRTYQTNLPGKRSEFYYSLSAHCFPLMLSANLPCFYDSRSSTLPGINIRL